LDRFETEGLLSGSKERSWLWFGLIISLRFTSRSALIFTGRVFNRWKAWLLKMSRRPRSRSEHQHVGPRQEQCRSDKSSAKPNPDNTDVQLPDEKKSFDKLLQDIQASAALPDDMRDVLPDQPKVEQPEVNSVLTEIERSTAQSLASDPNALHQQSLLQQ
jgi:hypothetical protein